MKNVPISVSSYISLLVNYKKLWRLPCWNVQLTMLTMQNTFQSGICGQEKSSTAEILGSLSQAITGYVPIVTMLGNEVRVKEER